MLVSKPSQAEDRVEIGDINDNDQHDQDSEGEEPLGIFGHALFFIEIPHRDQVIIFNCIIIYVYCNYK